MWHSIMNLIDGSKYGNGVRLGIIFVVLIILFIAAVLVGRGITKSK